MLRLGRQSIDIAPGEKHYTITDSFVLPVDVEVQAVQPHAHYRAREVTGVATLPDGTTKWLISIKDWDVRWQHVYRYVTPFALPRGTTLAVRYTYDNSADNPRNPEQPPRRCPVGAMGERRMGDLWIPGADARRSRSAAAERRLSPQAPRRGHRRLRDDDPADPSRVQLHDDVAVLYLELGRARRPPPISKRRRR
jgi:hypothetical protein